ncbi:hypothetical protein BZA70DRAFT_276568 [Myxozyma melibiosi]|uniref:Proteinase inhibitor I78 n=1 Tax=Myxozyma melibiosi TaxID=54550 RepID=A0ABR1FBC2_9ASCO
MNTQTPYGYDAPKAKEWSARLVGKQLVKSGPASDNTFVETDLPRPSRVIKPGTLSTMDFDPKRLNVTVDGSGVVQHVRTG